MVCEGTSEGEHRDGKWRAGAPEHGAGRWCDVFEIRDWKIQRCFIYLDPIMREKTRPVIRGSRANKMPKGSPLTPREEYK